MFGKSETVKVKRIRSVPTSAVALLFISGVFVLLLAVLVGIGIRAQKSKPPVQIPETESQFEAQEALCRKFLSPVGKRNAKDIQDRIPFYSVEAKLDEKRRELSCKVNVLFPNTTGMNLKDLAFRVYPNIICENSASKSVRINSASVNKIRAKFSMKGEILMLKPSFTLKRGVSYLISIDLTEPIPPIGTSAISGQESDKGMGIFGYREDVFNLGCFIPAIAKLDNGHWQTGDVPEFADRTPHYCANYIVYLDVPRGFTALASGYQFSKREGGGRTVFGFAAGVSRDFGAQVAKDRFLAERKTGSTRLKIAVSKGHREVLPKLAECSLAALREYQRKFGALPYGNITVCEAPLSGNAGGMEFTGLVFISSSLLSLEENEGKGLYEELEQSLPEDLKGLLGQIGGSFYSDTLEFVIAHEMCHQWFGISVGSDSILHPWQDESLVNYLAAKYFYLKYGEDRGNKVLEEQILAPYRIALMGGIRHLPVDSPAYQFQNITQYTAIIYGKGALFFVELEKEIGTGNLFAGLSDYYHDFIFEQAKSDELVSSLRKEAKDIRKFDAIYKRWIKEVHPEEPMPPFSRSFKELNELFEKFRKEGQFDFGPFEKMFDDLLDRYFNRPPDSEDRKERVPFPEPEKGSPVI